MPGPFRFALEPSLEAARRECDECEAAVRQAMSRIDEIRDQIQRNREIAEELTQLKNAAHDNLTSSGVSGIELMGESARINRIRVDLAKLDDCQVELHDQLTWAHDNLKLQKSALQAAEARTQALERLREKASAKHRAERERREEADRDDQAIQNWVRRRRPNDS